MPKRLVVACDGTWNRPDQLNDGVVAPTNVLKLALAVARVAPDGVAQELHYEPGVGTRRLERLRGGAFGFGLSRNVRDAYAFLVDRYEPGDELYFFGFSRGAYTARSAAGMVRNCGILRREHADRIDEAYRLYRSRDEPTKPNGLAARVFRRMYAYPDEPIHFIGVWDTVGALGIPTGALRMPWLTRRWSFHDVKLSTQVRFAYHALAIDEHRPPFRPTLWDKQDGDGDQHVEQVWFSGVHCDVGGGYRDPALAEITVLWMVERARAAGLAFDPDRFAVRAAPSDDDRRLAIAVAPDALGELHESRKGMYKLLASFERPLGGDAVRVASSAVHRRLDARDYHPHNLETFLEGHPLTVDVRDSTAQPV